jgi:hypothetical protein
VCWLPEPDGREELLRSSRMTSVLPFQIIETLARGTLPIDEWKAGTLLGEAFWRIDDLTDLCDDARSGALNAVLLRASPEDYDPLGAVENLPRSPLVAAVAAEAAECLVEVSSSQAGRRGAMAEFLYFIERYAGLPAADRS